MAMASFIAGFVAVCLPVGLGNEGDYAARADRLDFVLPARDLDQAVSEAADTLRAAGIPAEVAASAPPSWLDERAWGTLTVITSDDLNKNRVRTALTDDQLWGPELRLSDDIPVVWLLRDGVVVSFLVLPVAAMVALTSMMIGAIARIYDQRESLIALTLAGTPSTVLHAARRREMILPTIILGGIATAAGLLSGSTLGVASLFNLHSASIFLALLTLGALALLLADRTTRPVLDRTSTDLSERE
jgi:hypothetical protein